MVTTVPQSALLSPPQAAEYLNVAKQTLAHWRCRHGVNLPFFRVGGRVRYRLADLEAFLASRKVGGAAAANETGDEPAAANAVVQGAELVHA